MKTISLTINQIQSNIFPSNSTAKYAIALYSMANVIDKHVDNIVSTLETTLEHNVVNKTTAHKFPNRSVIPL